MQRAEYAELAPLIGQPICNRRHKEDIMTTTELTCMKSTSRMSSISGTEAAAARAPLQAARQGDRSRSSSTCMAAPGARRLHTDVGYP
jgi:hypothetical protein